MIYSLDDIDVLVKNTSKADFLSIFAYLNMIDKLNDVVKFTGIGKCLPEKDSSFSTLKNGKILVLGFTPLRVKDINGIFKIFGISKDRVELCVLKEDIKVFDSKKLEYNPKYSAVLVGPVPHKTVSTGDFDNLISKLENTEGYPPVKRTCSSIELKITNSSLKKAIRELIDEGVICV